MHVIFVTFSDEISKCVVKFKSFVIICCHMSNTGIIEEIREVKVKVSLYLVKHKICKRIFPLNILL